MDHKKISGVSRNLVLAFIAALCLQMFTPLISYAAEADNGPAYEYFSKSNAPVLYGTTSIRVPAGTVVDYLRDARFRVFAKDNEDFDLTNQIQITSSTVDPSQPLGVGSYTISYSVTDSDGNAAAITVPITVEENGEEIWLQKTMYTLPSVDHLNEVGHTRGNHMDRQIIGIFLDDDGVDGENVPSFEMRKISGSGDLAVPLQNNNGWCESTATVKGENSADGNDGWQEIKNTGSANAHDGSLASVPTVKTLYKESGPVVYEVRWNAADERIKPLHYYHEGDGFEYETRFLAEWQADADSFAVLDGVSFLALMPYEDRAKVYNKTTERSFDSFDEMFRFWTRVLDEYDKLIGISYTPDHWWDQAVKTKYFVRANKHGAGGAYYAAGDCIGKNSTSMYSVLHPWWGTLHEYGHGYQGNVGSSGYGMPITEVAVNIFSYYIQRVSGFYPIMTENWLGDIDTKETEWNNKRKQGIEFTDSVIGSDTTLYALLNILLTFEDYTDTYAYINRYFREVYFTTGKKLRSQDAYILALAEKYHVNFVPYFESWGLTVSDSVKNEMMASGAEAVYYLSDMIADGAAATQLKDKFGVTGEYGLVTSSQLKAENLTGKVKIKFNISDFSRIQGKYLYINNGGEQIAKVRAASPEMTLELPAGIYKAAPPKSDTALECDRFYMTVTAGAETSYEIDYKEYNSISGGNDVIIYCRGYWNEDSHPFTVQVKGDKMHFDYQDTYPNSGGTGGQNVFSKLTLTSDSGETVYEKSVNGGWYDTFVDGGVTHEELPAAPGDKLTIYYRNPQNDMRYVSQLTGEPVSGFEIPTSSCERTYVVTQYGLVPEDALSEDQNAAYEMYKSRIKQRTEKLLQEMDVKDLDDPFGANSELISLLTNLVSHLTPEDQAEYAGIFLNEPASPKSSRSGGGDAKSGNTTVIDPDGKTVTPDQNGSATAPKGSVVTPPSGRPDITLPNGGAVDKNGSITLPGGSSAEIGRHTVTMPEEGGTIEPNHDGSVTLPSGAIIEDGDGNITTVPASGGMIVHDGAGYTVTFHSKGGSEAPTVERMTRDRISIALYISLLFASSLVMAVVLTRRKRSIKKKKTIKRL